MLSQFMFCQVQASCPAPCSLLLPAAHLCELTAPIALWYLLVGCWPVPAHMKQDTYAVLAHGCSPLLRLHLLAATRHHVAWVRAAGRMTSGVPSHRVRPHAHDRSGVWTGASNPVTNCRHWCGYQLLCSVIDACKSPVQSKYPNFLLVTAANP